MPPDFGRHFCLAGPQLEPLAARVLRIYELTSEQLPGPVVEAGSCVHGRN
jgi:hypothetical protein